MNMDWTWNTLPNCLQTQSKKWVQRCRLYSFPPFPGWNRTSHTRTNIMHGHSSKLYPTTLVAVFSGSKYVGSSSPVGKFKVNETTNFSAEGPVLWWWKAGPPRSPKRRSHTFLQLQSPLFLLMDCFGLSWLSKNPEMYRNGWRYFWTHHRVLPGEPHRFPRRCT